MDTLSLNKPWKFTIDPENVGLRDTWHAEPKRLLGSEREIVVPSCWEEIEEDYEGVAWYATTVAVNADKAGQIARLCFEAANYRTQVWINGREIGTHEGGYTPFHFEVQDALAYGTENTIVARIISPIVTKAIQVDDLGPNDMPHWRGGLTAGIWQGVRLQFNASAWISSAFYQPDIADGSFTLALEVQSGETDALQIAVSLTLTAADGNPAVATEDTLTLSPGANHLEHHLPLVDPVLWDCENPHLYTATIELKRDGAVIARSIERIGLRTFTYENERFCLNGKQVYLRGGFWEGVYALHQSYPENRDVIRREIALAKALGFNLLRPWRRPVPPMILEEADAAGLLIIASPAVECMSCWPSLTPDTPRRIEDEIRQLILRDRNHASIIWWEMFNEVTREPIAKLIPGMSQMARELDPTRLVLDESGGWADGAHFYLPRSNAIESLAELHSYVRAPVAEKQWKLYQELGEFDLVEGGTEIKQGAGLFVSEFGYGGYPEFEENCRLFQKHGNPKLPAYRHHHKLLGELKAAMTACGLDKLYPDVDTLCLDSQAIQARGNLRQTEALLANPNVSGYCMHAFTDGDWIIGAGLIDLWQRPKAVYHAVQEANRLPRLLAFPERRNLPVGEAVPCRLVLRGEHAPLPTALNLSRGAASHTIADLAWSEGTDFRSLTIEVPAELLVAGANAIELRPVGTDVDALSTATIELYVVDFPALAQTRALVVYDPENDVSPWLDQRGYTYTRLESWSDQDVSTCFLFVPEEVTDEAHLPYASAALAAVEAGRATAIFLEPPASHEAKWALEYYGGCSPSDPEINRLLQAGVFPFKLKVQASFALWEASLHVTKPHPIFDGLPHGCMMDEPYQEVVPVESLVHLEAIEAPAQSITWFRPEDKDKARKRTYLGGDPIWHGTDLAVKAHGAGSIVLSTLLLRRKVAQDPVAQRILGNLIAYAETL